MKRRLSVSIGQLIRGRFLIIEKIGEGSIGQVYKVYDTEAQEYIALKFINPRLSDGSRKTERLWREIRIARKLTHPNICRLYDLEKEDQISFLKMEYVEGENLRDTLARVGAFNVKKAIEVAKQICQALEEGHRLGVIHRGLKPQNIMIDSLGKVKIMDFGVIPPETQSKRKGFKPKALDYAAPELVAGQKTDIRADFYSLGVVLYEMLTGRKPFSRTASLSESRQKADACPPSPQEVNPAIPDRLAGLIFHLLETNPEKRPSNAKKILHELDSISREVALHQVSDQSGQRAHLWPSAVRSKWSRLMMILRERKILHTLAIFIGGGAVIWEFVHWILIDHYHFPEGTLDITLISIGGALIASLIWQWFRWESQLRRFKVEYFIISIIIITSLYFNIRIFSNLTGYNAETLTAVTFASFPEEWKNSIAVLPIRDLSSSKDQAVFCEGILDGVITKLRVQFPELKVLSKQAVMKYQGAEYDLEQIGRELQVGLALETGLLVEGNRIRVNSRLVDLKDKSVIWAYPYEGEIRSIFQLQDEIAQGISQKFNLHLFQEGIPLIKAKEALDINAYRDYLQGAREIELYYQSRDERHFSQALIYFQKAIQADKSFALAYWGIGNAHECRFNFRKEKQDYNLMHEYYIKAHEIAPDLPEANLGLGWSFFYQGKINQAFRSFARAQSKDPTSFEVNFDLASFFRSLGLYEQASVFYSRALTTNPTSTITYELGAACFLYQGRTQQAAIFLQKGLSLQPENYRFYILQAQNYLRQKEAEETKMMLEIANQLRPGSRHVTLNLAWLAAYLGEKEKALELLKEVKGVYPSYEKANVYALLGMKEEALQTIEDGISQGIEKFGEHLFPYLYLIHNSCFVTLQKEERLAAILAQEKQRYNRYLQSLKMFNKN